MPAFALGEKSPLEQRLIRERFLHRQEDGTWRVITHEAKEEGELAKTGDYIKLDSSGMPYPTEKDWFEANHTLIGEGLYLQTAHPRKAWCSAEPICPEVRFLLDRGLLRWDPEDPEQAFQAELWGTRQSAARDAVVVLDRVESNSRGDILKVEFHFVAAAEFRETYEILPDCDLPAAKRQIPG